MAVETSPLGDTRNHPVPCQEPTCRQPTLNHSARCDRHLTPQGGE